MKKAQTTSTIVMVRPANFGFNVETAENNFYQQKDARGDNEINQLAQAEFDTFVNLLRSNDIEVIVIEDTATPSKSDAIFPNNWFSTHQDGTVILYPMFSRNRRLERRKDILEILMSEGFKINEVVDLSFFEQDNQFLEGTGSLIFDRVNDIAYACKSIRTQDIPLQYLARLLSYEICDFEATQLIEDIPSPIYHTNVMMHVGSQVAVVCLDSVQHSSEKLKLKETLEQSGKKIIPITAKQKFSFAGNMLEVKNTSGQSFTIMSQTAYDSLSKAQKNSILKYTKIITPDIPTIEKIGGGSVRCMMAEIFLPRD
ncbi:citrulline utilization hydrolase CtlX [Belliella kenyensis]|uniref:Citrulline utilization hydrolase CtlX n=1 Tax=Belliella kenyensis TaxID=1472724 RepID=A0ABV8ENV6_9BACT|nr:arginine deiminase-related protein [Belliella kenyensis]MCH7403603.1 arginine deiminase-related protein [Belliella kenyensis]MDN3603845.1 arginine deiminase-related protein [Belliella kenyensis]